MIDGDGPHIEVLGVSDGVGVGITSPISETDAEGE